MDYLKKGKHTIMATTSKWGSESMIKISSNELEKYMESTDVFLSRTTICQRIIELQNDMQDNQTNSLNLLTLITTFYSQAMENISRRRYIKISAKLVDECFASDSVPVYIEE